MFRAAHAIWTLLWLVICLLLATASGGHPPGLVFVPFALAAWAVGHLTLWGSHRLVLRGARAGRVGSIESASWPISVVLLLIAGGVVFFVGIAALVRGFLFDEPRPIDWWILLIWSTHSACFVGLLLRQPWSRVGAGMICSLWSLLLVYLFAEHLYWGRPSSFGEFAFVIGLIAALALMAQRMLYGRSARAYFRKG